MAQLVGGMRTKGTNLDEKMLRYLRSSNSDVILYHNIMYQQIVFQSQTLFFTFMNVSKRKIFHSTTVLLVELSSLSVYQFHTVKM